MRNRIFVDSNVWLYLFLQDDNNKYKTAERFLSDNRNSTLVVSYQVINEVSNVLLKKGYSETRIRECIDHFFGICTLQEFTKEILLTASFAREKYSLSFWDSNIVGSALFSKCDTLISEDMQNGLVVNDKLLISNIFENKG